MSIKKERFSKLSKKSYMDKIMDRNSLDYITIPFLTKPHKSWNERISESEDFPRHWKTTVGLKIVLSDGYRLKIPKGTIWDGASIPKWLWWLFKPIDNGALGDLIHDELWRQKEKQFKYFGYNVFKARKFADKERLIWRKKLSPKTKIKNAITHIVIRAIGGLFYSKQLEIPS